MSDMKRILLFLCFAMTVSILKAQKIYFVYLQTENNEAFFVRMDDKLYSSSPSGYLILPRLKDSTYRFRLGFPGKDVDLDFSTTINRKDHGYLVKNFGEKGWGLFDLQSLSIQMSTTKAKGTAEVNKSGDNQVDAFTELLSKAADDPSLKQNVVLVKEQDKKPVAVEAIQKEEKKPEVTDAVVKEEKKVQTNTQADDKLNEKKSNAADNVPGKKPEVAAAVTDQRKAEVNIADNKTDEKKIAIDGANEKQTDSTAKMLETSRADDVYQKSLVTKISERDTREGFESVFVDEQNGSKDTIRILIPAANKEAVAKEEAKPDSTREKNKFLETDPNTKQPNEAKNKQQVKWWPFGNPFAKKDKEVAKDQSATKSPPTTQPTTKSQSPTKSQPSEKSEEPKKWNPFAKKDKAATKDQSANNSQPTKSKSPTNSQPTEKKEEHKKWNPFAKNKTTTGETKKCESAAHEDFLKLRRRMAEKTNDDGMLEEARKYFKEKCFTTEQVKNLSTMFLSNAGKYNFFELAHNNVTDKDNFSSLQSELKDEYYVNRFNMLVGN
jgi:Domain of unknown function (DUF4476)